MAEVTASSTNRTKQSFQSFGFVIFSFIADIISIVIAVQQQQMGRSGIGILALFLSTLTIAQILYITQRISAIRQNIWPLMVGIVYSAGILALCSRIWSGSNWWQWVLISLLIPVASLVFITWKYSKASQEMQSPFKLDQLGQWFGFAALGFVADILAIVGAVKAQDWGDIFAAIGLVLTLIVVISILFITREESRASNQKGPLITGLFTSVGLTVAYLYIWIDLALWESLVSNMLVMSLALIIGLLRCATNQSDISISGTKAPIQNEKSTRKSAQGQNKDPKTSNPKVSTGRRPGTAPQAVIRNRHQPGEDLGNPFGSINPKKPSPNSPSSPNLINPAFLEGWTPSNVSEQQQTSAEDLNRFTAPIPQERKATASNETKQDKSMDTFLYNDALRKESQDNPVTSIFEALKPEEKKPDPTGLGFTPLILDPSMVEKPQKSPEKQDALPIGQFPLQLDPKERRMLEGSQESNIPKQNEPSLSKIIGTLFVSSLTGQKRVPPHVSEGTDEHSEQVNLPNPLLNLTSKLGKPDQNLVPDLGVVTSAESDKARILGISPIFLQPTLNLRRPNQAPNTDSNVLPTEPSDNARIVGISPTFFYSAPELEEQGKTPKIDLGLSSAKSSDDTKNSEMWTTPYQVETNIPDEALRTWRIPEKQNPKEEDKQGNENTVWRNRLPDTTQAQDASSESAWPTQAYLLNSASKTETVFFRDRWKPGDPINIQDSITGIGQSPVKLTGTDVGLPNKPQPLDLIPRLLPGVRTNKEDKNP